MTEKKPSKRDEILVRLETNPDVAEGRLNPALRIISERCLSVMDVDRINIWKMSPQEDIFQSVDAFDQSLKIHSSGEIFTGSLYPTFLAALQSERYLSVKDVQADHRTMEMTADLWKPLNIASALIVPIRIRGKLGGMVRFEQSRAKHNWSQEEATFACQIAEMIAGVFLMNEISEMRDQMRSHEDTISEMGRLSSFHTILTEALHRMIGLTGARSAMLFKNIPARREIECILSVNTPIPFSGIVMAYGEGAAGTVAEVGRSLRIQDYRMWSGRASEMEEQHPFTSVLAVPVRFQGRITGVIEVAHHDITSHFTEGHRQILETFARDVAVILEHSGLNDEIAALSTHAYTLEKLITTSSLAGRMESYLESVLNTTLKRFGLGRGILRVDRLAMTQDVSEEEENQITERLSADQSGFNTEIVIPDWRDYSGAFTALAGLFSTMNAKGSMFVPLWNESTYWGYLGVFSTSPREWHEQEISLMQLIAKQVVITVEKLNGARDRESVIRNLARLNAITSDLNRQLTFDDAIERVGQGVVELLHADHAALYLKNPDGCLSAPWQFAISDTHLQKVISFDDREVIQLLLGMTRPVAYQNLRATPLPVIFKRYMTNAAIATVVCLPLVYSNQAVGAIVTFHNFTRTLSEVERDLLEVFSNQAAVTLQNAWMYDQLDRGYTDLALSLARIVDLQESAVSGTTQRVAKWAEETGRKLGLNDQEIRDLHWAAMLHDIGKSSVPVEILEKSGPLSEEERKVIQKYPAVGAEMIQPLSRFQTVSDIIRSYRERFDGHGYPEGLKGEEIPLSARVLSVADSFGSIIAERPYHHARSEEEALHEIEGESGQQFDPAVVKVFVDVVRQTPRVPARKQPAVKAEK
jgi:HD-GYP domain-containing protein (c-di-GMP phosphodiesterase class II)